MPTANANSRYLNRAAVNQRVAVMNSLQGQLLGNIVNLHSEGFMLIGDVALNEEGVYQLEFQLTSPILSRDSVTLGAECLWVRETGGGDQSWAGFQIIDISDEDKKILILLGEQI